MGFIMGFIRIFGVYRVDNKALKVVRVIRAEGRIGSILRL